MTRGVVAKHNQRLWRDLLCWALSAVVSCGGHTHGTGLMLSPHVYSSSVKNKPYIHVRTVNKKFSRLMYGSANSSRQADAALHPSVLHACLVPCSAFPSFVLINPSAHAGGPTSTIDRRARPAAQAAGSQPASHRALL